MKPAINTVGIAALLVLSCGGSAPQEAPSPAPLPPARADIKILPGSPTPVQPMIGNRYPMVIIEVDPSRFPMPVTQGRIGHYPIRVIPPKDLEYAPLQPVPRAAPRRSVPMRPGK